MSPFGGPHVLRFTTSTHDEYGHITKDPKQIQLLNEHLNAKIEDHIDEIAMLKCDFQDNADTLIISYGIVARAVDDAVEKIRDGGGLVSAMTVYSLFPVPENAIRSAMETAHKILVPELNRGQYRREIERLCENGQQIIEINHLDGSLISPTEIMSAGGWL
jgi:2-oxoglutarate ferredoxin oxidoreductase subunit alpha